jgi:hypothetical protein
LPEASYRPDVRAESMSVTAAGRGLREDLGSRDRLHRAGAEFVHAAADLLLPCPLHPGGILVLAVQAGDEPVGQQSPLACRQLQRLGFDLLEWPGHATTVRSAR